MQPGHFTSLLPEQFRHKSSRVRVLQPQVVLLDFHGTISERRWEDKVITPYVQQATESYLKEHINDEPIQNSLAALRQESFEVAIRHKYEEAPLIEGQSDELESEQLAKQVADFMLWQVRAKKETKETLAIQRLIWIDGFERKQILTPLFTDVMPTVKKWHDHFNCKIYLTSSLDVLTLRCLMENTNQGSLDALLSGYLTAKRVGDKLIKQTYKKFYEQAILDPTTANSSISTEQQTSKNGHSKATSSPNNKQTKSPNSTNSVASETTLAKPILFLTDSGQEAKAASSVLDGSVFECLLVNRPGNKRIRSYYLSRFQYVDKFDDIEFV